MTDLIIPLLKKCTKCGSEYPATPDYFHRAKTGRDGLRSDCKLCVQAYHKSNSKLLSQRAMEYQKAYPEKQKEYVRRWRRKHPEYNQRWRQRNPELVREQTRRQEATRDKEKKRLSTLRWRKNNPERHSANRRAYRGKKRGLPVQWNNHYWLKCLGYWHYCCAVCGAQLRDLFGKVKPNADHWIPLDYKGADNPGTVPGNMICLCNSCNSSKNYKLPEVWLMERYGNRKAAEILKRVKAYFEWITSQTI